RQSRASDGDARRPRVDRSRMPEALGQTVRRLRGRPTDGAPRRHRLASARETRVHARRDVLLQLPRPDRERVLDDQSGLRRSAVHRQHLRSRVEGMSGRSAPEAGIDFERMIADSRARVFLASFLVLFLEITLIRWMPAYVRLLSYFSNFILLASFLGIG